MLDIEDKIRWLRAVGAGQHDHINGTLLLHLQGTRRLLQKWRASAALQDAGLYHAVYSTAGFRARLIDLEQRSAVAAMIGVRAETIVYHYCACAREIFYPALARSTTAPFPDRFSGQTSRLPRWLMAALCELTVANEVDIAVHNPQFLRKHGADRYRTYRSMSPHLSAPARAAVETVFGDRDRSILVQAGKPGGRAPEVI